MTNNKKIVEDTTEIAADVPVYFWLGADGETMSMTAKEFEDEQEESRESLRRYLNVTTKSEEQQVGG